MNDKVGQGLNGRARRLGRRPMFAAVALIGGCAVGLIGVETIVRLVNLGGAQQRASWHFLLREGIRPSADPEKIWEHVPGYERTLLGYGVRINELGLRGPPIDEAFPAKGVRILALGDSMTFGMSAPESASYPAQLQGMLRREHPDRPIEVVNAGVLGYTTLQEEALARELLPVLAPDLVVLWWYPNDVRVSGKASKMTREGQLHFLLGRAESSPARNLIHLGYEMFPCATALLRAVTIGRRDGPQAPKAFTPETQPEGWRINRASLERILGLCRRAGVPIMVYSYGRFEALGKICAMWDVQYLSSAGGANWEGDAAQYAVSKVDPHFDAAGGRRVAETIAPAIENLWMNLTEENP